MKDKLRLASGVAPQKSLDRHIHFGGDSFCLAVKQGNNARIHCQNVGCILGYRAFGRSIEYEKKKKAKKICVGRLFMGNPGCGTVLIGSDIYLAKVGELRF